MSRQTIYDKVETPEALDRMVSGVAKGHYQSLIIIGRGGTGKSTVVKKHFPENDELDPPTDKNKGAFWKRGRISAVKWYEHCYRFRDRTLIMDDAPGLSNNLPLAGILRQLCETETTRRVSWDTQNHYLMANEIPLSFLTKSKFILIANEWMRRHPEIEALETRCLIVQYNPSVSLIHEQALAGMKAKMMDGRYSRFEPEVMRYIGTAIKSGRVHTLNLRDYIMAGRRLRNGDDWQPILEQQFLPDEIDNLGNDADYVLAWIRRTGFPRFTHGAIYRSTTRFRKEPETLKRVLQWMVKHGHLIIVPPAVHRFGRPPETEYAIPATSQKSQKSQKSVGRGRLKVTVLPA